MRHGKTVDIILSSSYLFRNVIEFKVLIPNRYSRFLPRSVNGNGLFLDC